MYNNSKQNTSFLVLEGKSEHNASLKRRSSLNLALISLLSTIQLALVRRSEQNSLVRCRLLDQIGDSVTSADAFAWASELVPVAFPLASVVWICGNYL